jgi:hypothetical protein
MAAITRHTKINPNVNRIRCRNSVILKVLTNAESMTTPIDFDYTASQLPPAASIFSLAEAENETISVDEKELAEARWFSVTEIKDAFNGTAEFDIPPSLAIAHHLIKAFVEMKG